MLEKTAVRFRSHVKPVIIALTALSPFFIAPHSAAQQSYIGLFDLYGGFGYLDSPNIDLAQRGFHFQAGLNPKTWLSLGFDYSRFTGNSDITPNLLTNTLQQSLGSQFAALGAAGRLPPGYSLVVPFNATTQTFAAGPQLVIRHWSAVTLFVRPAIGAIHETAVLHGTDPIAQGVVAQLAPTGQKQDWTPFYGFGGGTDINFGGHFSLRMQVDFVHNHLFSDVLKNGRNTVRLSIGPAVHFGRNMAK